MGAQTPQDCLVICMRAQTLHKHSTKTPQTSTNTPQTLHKHSTNSSQTLHKLSTNTSRLSSHRIDICMYVCMYVCTRKWVWALLKDAYVSHFEARTPIEIMCCVAFNIIKKRARTAGNRFGEEKTNNLNHEIMFLWSLIFFGHHLD